MGDYIRDHVRVPDDSEVESPVSVDPCLPFVFGSIVFLGMKRRVAEILF